MVSQSTHRDHPQPDVPRIAGAHLFVSFIKSQVIPMVESKFRANVHDRTLYGHSLGGLFGFYTMLNYPNTFQRIISLSPSLWSGCKLIFNDIHKSTNLEKPVKLYVATGEFENKKHHCENQSMVDHHLEMVDLLKNSKKLTIKSEILDMKLTGPSLAEVSQMD